MILNRWSVTPSLMSSIIGHSTRWCTTRRPKNCYHGCGFSWKGLVSKVFGISRFLKRRKRPPPSPCTICWTPTDGIKSTPNGTWSKNNRRLIITTQLPHHDPAREKGYPIMSPQVMTYHDREHQSVRALQWTGYHGTLWIEFLGPEIVKVLTERDD